MSTNDNDFHANIQITVRAPFGAKLRRVVAVDENGREFELEIISSAMQRE